MPHISLIAPSSPLHQADVNFIKQYLETLGMQITVPPNLLGKDLLCAHQDDLRAAHLQTALTDPSIDIVWLLVGGYGLTRLIPSLLPLKKPAKEKLFIGFSDGSVLHVFLNQFWNWPSLHGSGAIQLSKKKVGEKSINAILSFIQKGLSSYETPTLRPFNKQAKEMSSLSGILSGGNLCLLTCSLGTDWQVNPRGKILFLEDVDERGYRIDRMLAHLQQARIFEGVQAIILGDFVKGNEPNGTSLIAPVLERFAAETPLPIFRLPGSGHGDENFPLPFNTPLTFAVSKDYVNFAIPS